jgi:hypothetical protein
MRPLTTAQVCDAVMLARGLDTNDRGLCRVMMRRTNANLKHWAKKRGLIRSMPGPGQQLLWEVVRANAPNAHLSDYWYGMEQSP